MTCGDVAVEHTRRTRLTRVVERWVGGWVGRSVQRMCATHSCYCVVNSSTTVAPVKSTCDSNFVVLDAVLC